MPIVKSEGSLRRISVPRLNDEPNDFKALFALSDLVRSIDDPIVLLFHQCDFLRQNAVAFLGGLLATAELMDRSVTLDTDSMPPGVRRNLMKNGFLAGRINAAGWHTGTVVPYRGDPLCGWSECGEALNEHLYAHLLDKDWIYMSARVKREVANTINEIYTNAFEHSRSEAGVFSCGQYYPKISQVGLSIIDFGVGIPETIRTYLNSTERVSPETISSIGALEWALTKGNSTKNRIHCSGMGLDFVQDFMRATHGVLDIYTHDAAVRVDADGPAFRSIETYFPGTAVNLRLQCDGTKYYKFADEEYHGCLLGGELTES